MTASHRPAADGTNSQRRWKKPSTPREKSSPKHKPFYIPVVREGRTAQRIEEVRANLIGLGVPPENLRPRASGAHVPLT